MNQFRSHFSGNALLRAIRAANGGEVPAPIAFYSLLDSLPGDFGLTRSSTATYWDSSLVQSAAVDAARFEADGLLIEAHGTNDLTYSEDFTNWTAASGATVTANSDNAPDGTATADTLTDPNAAAASLLRSTVAGYSAARRFFSCYIKKTSGATSFPRLQVYAQTDNSFSFLNINTDTGETSSGNGGGAGLGSVVASGAESRGDYWLAWFVTDWAASATPTAMLYEIFPARGTTYPTPSAAATGSIVAWGAMGGDMPLYSYIPTTTGSAPRSADAATGTVQLAPCYSLTFSLPLASADYQDGEALLHVTGGGVSFAIRLGAADGYSYAAGLHVFTVDKSAFAANQASKIAVQVYLGQAQMAVDGALVVDTAAGGAWMTGTCTATLGDDGVTPISAANYQRINAYAGMNSSALQAVTA